MAARPAVHSARLAEPTSVLNERVADRDDAMALVPVELFSTGERLPSGVEVFPGRAHRTMNGQACAHTLDQSHRLFEP